MLVLLALVVTLVIHLLLGWEWTLLGGVLYGWMLPERAWMGGMAVVGGAWGLLTLFDWLTAPEPFSRMVGTVGQIMGNLPAPMIVVLTVLIGCLLGLFGGLIGRQLHRLIPKRHSIRRT